MIWFISFSQNFIGLPISPECQLLFSTCCWYRILSMKNQETIHWRITFWHGSRVLKGGSRGPPGSQVGGGRGPRTTCRSHPCGAPVHHLSTLPTPISSSSTKIIPIQRIFCEFLIQSLRCRGNQSGSLFGYSVGWGNHRRMHLHHHFRLRNDAWVVRPWTTGL